MSEQDTQPGCGGDLIRERARQFHTEYEASRKALEGTAFVPVPIDQLADVYRRFKRLTYLGQATLDEWLAMPKDVADLRHAIFAEADFGAVYAGLWLPKAERERVRAEVVAERKAASPLNGVSNDGNAPNTDETKSCIDTPSSGGEG